MSEAATLGGLIVYVVRGRISTFTGVGLLVTLVGPTAVLSIVGPMISMARQDAWISGVLLTLYGLVVTFVAIALALRSPRQNFTQLIEGIFGKPGRYLIGLLYTWWFVFSTASILRQLADSVIITMLPRTPISIIIGVAVLGMLYAVRSDIGVIGRLAVLTLILTSATIGLTMLLVSADFAPQNLLPMFETGPLPIFQGAYPATAFIGQGMLLLVIVAPMVNRREDVTKIGVLATLSIGLLITITTVVTVAVMGSISGNISFPFLAVARYIRIAEFFTGIDPIFTTVWLYGIAMKGVIWLYTASLMGAQVLGLTDYLCLTIPLALVAGVLAIGFENSAVLGEFLLLYGPPYDAVFELVIPLGLLLGSLRKRDPSIHQG